MTCWWQNIFCVCFRCFHEEKEELYTLSDSTQKTAHFYFKVGLTRTRTEPVFSGRIIA